MGNASEKLGEFEKCTRGRRIGGGADGIVYECSNNIDIITKVLSEESAYEKEKKAYSLIAERGVDGKFTPHCYGYSDKKKAIFLERLKEPVVCPTESKMKIIENILKATGIRVYDIQYAGYSCHNFMMTKTGELKAIDLAR